MKRARNVGLLGALAALALACGSSEEAKPAASATPETPSTAAATPSAPAKGKVRTPTPEGIARREAANASAKITKGTLPDGFPSDLPLYPESKPTSSMMVGNRGLVVLTSNAPVADVVAHYRNQLPTQGWTIDSVREWQGGAKVALKAHKGLRNTTISVDQPKNGTGSEIGIGLD